MSKPLGHPESRRPSSTSSAPIYRQIYQRFRDAIAEGRMRPGDRVPSIRGLALEMGVARGTVELAYQTLIGEGYLSARGAAGTVVAENLPVSRRRLPGGVPTESASGRLRPKSPVDKGPAPAPLQLGLPALDAFPRKTWGRLMARQVRRLGIADLDYPDIHGLPALREALVAYLAVSRGIRCEVDQIFVVNGYLPALDLIRHALLAPGDVGWYENPGYPFARAHLRGLSMRLHPVPVDEQGLKVEAAMTGALPARFVLVTPSNQSPLGVALSLPRRLALIDWARAHRGWIIEDDYDSEYRYHGKPLPALASLDAPGRVCYVGTFSKVLYPGLRTAYLVVPTAQIERFEASALALRLAPPNLIQATIADFLSQGHFARHLNRTRRLYAQRRRWLVDALADTRLRVDLQAGGMHVIGWLPARADDVAIARRANESGLAVQALSRWYVGPGARQGLVMGFTNLSEPGEALSIARRLDQLIGRRSSPSG